MVILQEHGCPFPSLHGRVLATVGLWLFLSQFYSYFYSLFLDSKFLAKEFWLNYDYMPNCGLAIGGWEGY